MPAIVTPVMRKLGSADFGRAVAFYRDQLGFEITNEREGYAEATCGPARLEFGRHDYDPLSWEGPKPPGSAILYFEVDDVAAMRESILARGGAPSELASLGSVIRKLHLHKSQRGLFRKSVEVGARGGTG